MKVYKVQQTIEENIEAMYIEITGKGMNPRTEIEIGVICESRRFVTVRVTTS